MWNLRFKIELWRNAKEELKEVLTVSVRDTTKFLMRHRRNNGRNDCMRNWKEFFCREFNSLWNRTRKKLKHTVIKEEPTFDSTDTIFCHGKSRVDNIFVQEIIFFYFFSYSLFLKYHISYIYTIGCWYQCNYI